LPKPTNRAWDAPVFRCSALKTGRKRFKQGIVPSPRHDSIPKARLAPTRKMAYND
jgi:hypothetical protein